MNKCSAFISLTLECYKTNNLTSSSSPPSSHSPYVGSMYDDIRLHVARSYTSSADSPFSLISLYFVQPSSLRYSSLPSPLHLHFHRPPSYVVFLSSHHMLTNNLTMYIIKE